MKFSFDEMIDRMIKVMREMEGKELADLCNHTLGCSVEYEPLTETFEDSSNKP